MKLIACLERKMCRNVSLKSFSETRQVSGIIQRGFSSYGDSREPDTRPNRKPHKEKEECVVVVPTRKENKEDGGVDWREEEVIVSDNEEKEAEETKKILEMDKDAEES
jgi:hypothetical protein